MSGSSGQGTTFDLVNEEHTLANSLRYMLNKNSQVTFCGYSQPHPTVNSVHLRVQTKDEIDPTQALKEACGNINDMCAHIKEVFQQQFHDYKEKNSMA